MGEIVEIEIFFEDLREEVQKEVLEKLQIKHQKELNWDIIPMDIIQIDLDEFKEEYENLEEAELAEAEDAIIQGIEDPVGLFDKIEGDEE